MSEKNTCFLFPWEMGRTFGFCSLSWFSLQQLLGGMKSGAIHSPQGQSRGCSKALLISDVILCSLPCEYFYIPAFSSFQAWQASPCFTQVTFIISKFCGELAPDKEVPWEQIHLWRKCFKNYRQVFVASKSVFNSTYSVSQVFKILPRVSLDKKEIVSPVYFYKIGQVS